MEKKEELIKTLQEKNTENPRLKESLKTKLKALKGNKDILK